MKNKKFKKFIEENKWLKKVPNTLTICNSLCGFSAILYTLQVYSKPEDLILLWSKLGIVTGTQKDIAAMIFATSALIILCAMIFDALDGFAARIFNAASMHGVQMDSLADMVTFGVAPATVVAMMAHFFRNSINYPYRIVWGCCAIYIACAALRLATYNVHAILEKKSDNKFTGLPSPGAAAAICSTIIFYDYSVKHNINAECILYILPIYTAILGVLMIVPIKYVHMGKWIQSVRRNKARGLILIIVIMGLCLYPQITTVSVITIYILSGPFLTITKLLKNRG